jgi:alkylhydroperoxidase family enzyme
MTIRINPATPPFTTEIQDWLNQTMKGNAPLVLFTTLARDPRLFQKFFSAGLLDRGHLSLRQREIAINRTTALCKSEYEWGVHIALFAQAAKLEATHVYSTVHGRAQDTCWSREEALLIDLCDALHFHATVADALWQSLRHYFSDEAMLELIMLIGFYHTVSYLTNALALPMEPGAARFPPLSK